MAQTLVVAQALAYAGGRAKAAQAARWLCLMLGCLALAGCGAHSHSGLPPATALRPAATPAATTPAALDAAPGPLVDPLLATATPTTPGLAAALQRQLDSELARLHKSTTAAGQAPTGEADKVFAFWSEGYDKDGAGPEPVVLHLHWIEELSGDFDQNGEVNAADLAPLGQWFHQPVAYAPLAERPGLAHWPQGQQLGYDNAINNWRFARIDGDGNGELNGADATTIARQWKTRLTGYRVYRRAPGEVAFSPYRFDPQATDAAHAQSIAHPAATSYYDPVLYDFEETQDPPGRYDYYVAPYDATSGTEGIASYVFQVDTTDPLSYTSVVPVPVLKLNPEAAGAGQAVVLDGTGSYDPDRQLDAYSAPTGIRAVEWDIDGDGLLDYSDRQGHALLPNYPLSSSGLAQIEEDRVSGQLTVRYKSTAPQLIPVTLTVYDASGTSASTTQQLALTGWASDLVSQSALDASYPQPQVEFPVQALGADPATGELCAAGGLDVYNASFNLSGKADGLYFARRSAAGAWTQELVAAAPTPGWDDPDGFTVKVELGWELGQPLLLVERFQPGSGHATVYIARRGAGGWTVEALLPPDDADQRLVSCTTPAPGQLFAYVTHGYDGTRPAYALVIQGGPLSITPLPYGDFLNYSFVPGFDYFASSDAAGRLVLGGGSWAYGAFYSAGLATQVAPGWSGDAWQFTPAALDRWPYRGAFDGMNMAWLGHGQAGAQYAAVDTWIGADPASGQFGASGSYLLRWDAASASWHSVLGLSPDIATFDGGLLAGSGPDAVTLVLTHGQVGWNALRSWRIEGELVSTETVVESFSPAQPALLQNLYVQATPLDAAAGGEWIAYTGHNADANVDVQYLAHRIDPRLP